MGLLDEHRGRSRRVIATRAIVPLVVAAAIGACAAADAPYVHAPAMAAAPAVAASPQPKDMRRFKCKVRRVVDGDSFNGDIDMGLGLVLEDQAFRVNGINTPELHAKDPAERAAAEKARERLSEILFLEPSGIYIVVNERDPREKYGRILVRVETGAGVDVGQMMINEGLAKPYDGGKR